MTTPGLGTKLGQAQANKTNAKGSRTGAGAQANEISQEIHRHTDYESRHVPESRLTNTTPAHRQKKMNTSYVSRVFETACQSVSQSVSLKSVSQSVSQSVIHLRPS